MVLEVRSGKIFLTEFWGGTRTSSHYYYVVKNGKLRHVSKFAKGRLEYASRRGRRRVYVYEISLARICRDIKFVEIIEFSFTNKGYGPYAYKYVIDCSRDPRSLDDIEYYSVDVKDIITKYRVESINTRLLYELMIYDKYVIPIVKEINSISKKLGFELYISGHAVRLEDILTDPELGRFIAEILPTWQARQKLLEHLIRTIHEIYVMVLIPYALNARTIHHKRYDDKYYWYIEYASPIPTAVIETQSGKRYTIWFQFSPKDWWEVVLPNYAVSMLGLQQEKIPRQFVRPDIMVFEGEYEDRDNLSKNPPKRAWLIEAKMKFTENDLEQLRGYAENFRSITSRKLHFLVVGLENIPYKRYLEMQGYKVFEYVNPLGKGVRSFIDYIRNTMM